MVRRSDSHGVTLQTVCAVLWRLAAGARAGLKAVRLAVAAALVGGLAIGLATAQDNSPVWSMPPDAKQVSGLFFDILRNDQHIGTAHVEVFKTGGALEVRSRTEVFIKLGAATLYDFFQRARETWHNERLVSYYANTDDNGVERRVELRADAGGAVLIANGRPVAVSRDIAPTSLWHVSTLRLGQFFDPMLGLLHNVKLSTPTDATIKVRGKSTKTSYYTITGDIERKLWYLPNGTLVQLSLIAPDGSVVLYKLR